MCVCETEKEREGERGRKREREKEREGGRWGKYWSNKDINVSEREREVLVR